MSSVRLVPEDRAIFDSLPVARDLDELGNPRDINSRTEFDKWRDQKIIEIAEEVAEIGESAPRVEYQDADLLRAWRRGHRDAKSSGRALAPLARDEEPPEYCEHGLLRTQWCVRCVNEAARELDIR